MSMLWKNVNNGFKEFADSAQGFKELGKVNGCLEMINAESENENNLKLILNNFKAA